jgi:phosphoenolpyruvate carboxykinase (ATP)
MLGRKLQEHNAQVWLVNTGWTGGPFGVGHRMKLAYTRAMVRAAIGGEFDNARTHPDPVFGLHVPESIPGVPKELLDPRSTWSDPAAYDAAAQKLAGMFRDNFRKFEEQVSEGVRAAGPR